MTQVAVYTCSHKRAVVCIDGEYRHLAIGGRVASSTCNGFVYRSVVDILDSRTTLLRDPDADK